jgi:hypothetical protein
MAEQKPVEPPNRDKTPLGGVGPTEGAHENGIPHDGDHESAQPKGTPTSDRHQTETAPKRS